MFILLFFIAVFFLMQPRIFIAPEGFDENFWVLKIRAVGWFHDEVVGLRYGIYYITGQFEIMQIIDKRF